LLENDLERTLTLLCWFSPRRVMSMACSVRPADHGRAVCRSSRVGPLLAS
jgi:hypothetical protein